MSKLARLILVTSALDVLGVVWILQGLNVLPGSFMTGDPFWAGAGVALLLISGLILVVGVLRVGRRQRPDRPASDS